MKTTQKKTTSCPAKPTDRWALADLSPPENDGVKELDICVDGRNYSLQVAPLQRLFPLHSGKTNIGRLKTILQINDRLKLNVDKYLERINETFFKRKKEPKKEKRKGHGLSPIL